MPAPDDAALKALLLAVAAQDRVAFRKLYDAFSPKLFGTVLRIVRNRPAAEEVLQDVFLRIWQNASSYAPDTAPAGVWMNSIARNRSIDVLRQRGYVQVSAVDGASDWFEKVAEDRDREGDMIDNASLRHAYYEGFSREELAQRFGRPVNTIKTRLHRSLGTLRACLDGSPT